LLATQSAVKVLPAQQLSSGIKHCCWLRRFNRQQLLMSSYSWCAGSTVTALMLSARLWEQLVVGGFAVTVVNSLFAAKGNAAVDEHIRHLIQQVA
jgi:hypothetical protein